MADRLAKIANARRLAALAIERAGAYRAQGAPRMAAHHDHKARGWAAVADTLEADGPGVVSRQEAST